MSDKDISTKEAADGNPVVVSTRPPAESQSPEILAGGIVDERTGGDEPSISMVGVAVDRWWERFCRQISGFTNSVYAAIVGFAFAFNYNFFREQAAAGTLVMDWGFWLRLFIGACAVMFVVDDWYGSRRIMARLAPYMSRPRYIMRRLTIDLLVAAGGYLLIMAGVAGWGFFGLVLLPMLGLGGVWAILCRSELRKGCRDLALREGELAVAPMNGSHAFELARLRCLVIAKSEMDRELARILPTHFYGVGILTMFYLTGIAIEGGKWFAPNVGVDSSMFGRDLILAALLVIFLLLHRFVVPWLWERGRTS